jgi:hypothetical protein
MFHGAGCCSGNLYFGVLASYLGREQDILAEFCVVFNSISLPPLAGTPEITQGFHSNTLHLLFSIALQEIQLLGINVRVQNSVIFMKMVYEIIYYIISN